MEACERLWCTSRPWSAKSLYDHGPGPLCGPWNKGPGSSSAFRCFLMLSEQPFEAFWYKAGFETKNIKSNFRGGAHLFHPNWIGHLIIKTWRQIPCPYSRWLTKILFSYLLVLKLFEMHWLSHRGLGSTLYSMMTILLIIHREDSQNLWKMDQKKEKIRVKFGWSDIYAPVTIAPTTFAPLKATIAPRQMLLDKCSSDIYSGDNCSSENCRGTIVAGAYVGHSKFEPIYYNSMFSFNAHQHFLIAKWLVNLQIVGQGIPTVAHKAVQRVINHIQCYFLFSKTYSTIHYILKCHRKIKTLVLLHKTFTGEKTLVGIILPLTLP